MTDATLDDDDDDVDARVDALDDDALDALDARDGDDDADVRALARDVTTTTPKTTTTRDTTTTTRDVPVRVVGLVGVASLAIAFAAWRLFRWARGDADAGRPPRRADARFSRAHRKCNRCGARGDFVKVKCERCKRCWYCSQACKKAAWSMEICECC